MSDLVIEIRKLGDKGFTIKLLDDNSDYIVQDGSSKESLQKFPVDTTVSSLL